MYQCEIQSAKITYLYNKCVNQSHCTVYTVCLHKYKLLLHYHCFEILVMRQMFDLLRTVTYNYHTQNKYCEVYWLTNSTVCPWPLSQLSYKHTFN